MPFLDALGRSPEGSRFENHYAHWAQTMKAAFSIWCAPAAASGIPAHHLRESGDSRVSLPEALKASGYDTALFSSADFAFDRQIRFLRHRRFDAVIDRNEMPGRAGAWENTWGLDSAGDNRRCARLDPAAAAGTCRPAVLRGVDNMAAGHHPDQYPAWGIW